MYRIGELSKIVNLSVPTIRFYEEKGLIKPIKVDNFTNYRYYDDSSVERINKIIYFKNLGFSLNEILNLNDQSVKDKIKETKQQLSALKSNINTLSNLKAKEEKELSNCEFVETVVSILEEKHLNLYHSVEKKDVESFITSIDWDNLNAEQFDYNMLKLFSMFDDSQTSWIIKFMFLDKEFIYKQKELYLKDNNNYHKVRKVGHLNVEDFITEIKNLYCYETNSAIETSINWSLKNGYIFKLINVVNNNKIIVKVENNNSFEVNISDKPTQKYQLQKNYHFKLLENNILYIRYSRCEEDSPFEEFVIKIKNEIEKNNIAKYIIDIRDNTGGNSNLISPLKNLLAEKQLKGVMLINGGVFASACTAAAEFKKLLKVVLIGEPTGGAIKSYGESLWLQLKERVFRCSTRMFDRGSILGIKGSIEPDLYSIETISDIGNNYDKQLNDAIDYIKNNF